MHLKVIRDPKTRDVYIPYRNVILSIKLASNSSNILRILNVKSTNNNTFKLPKINNILFKLFIKLLLSVLHFFKRI